jgi:hypothetical protein
MQMIHCPNCGRPSGFKRALGFGTLFMVLITCGLWLLVIPLYPARCMNCGLRRAPALMQNYADWLKRSPTAAIISISILGVALLVALCVTRKPTGQELTNTVEDPPPPAAQSVSEDHELHLLPNPFGRGAVSDGRTYSVALLSAYNIPPGTQLFSQGVIGRIFADSISLRDEHEENKGLVCFASPEEIESAAYSYHSGDRVQVFGTMTYNGIAGVINFRECKFSSPTDKVVQLKTVPGQESGRESVGSDASSMAVQQSGPNAQAPDAQDQSQQTEPAGASPEVQPATADRSSGNMGSSTPSGQR